MTFILRLTFTELWVGYLVERLKSSFRKFNGRYGDLIQQYEVTLSRMMSGFHGAFATGVASKQGTLTLPETWFRPPFWDLLVLQLLRQDSSNLPCLYSTFRLEYPLVLSRFCSIFNRLVPKITYLLIGVLGKMTAITLLSCIECKRNRVEHNCLFICVWNAWFIKLPVNIGMWC